MVKILGKEPVERREKKKSERYIAEKFQVVEEIKVDESFGPRYYSMLERYGIWEHNAKAIRLIPAKKVGIGKRRVYDKGEGKLYEIWETYLISMNGFSFPNKFHIRFCEDEKCKNWNAVYTEAVYGRGYSGIGFYDNKSRFRRSVIYYLSNIITLNSDKVDKIESSNYQIYGPLIFTPLKQLLNSIEVNAMFCNEEDTLYCEKLINTLRVVWNKYNIVLKKINEIRGSPIISLADTKIIFDDLKNDLTKSSFTELIKFLYQEISNAAMERLDNNLLNKLPNCFPVEWRLIISSEDDYNEKLGEIYLPIIMCKDKREDFLENMEDLELYFFLIELAKLMENTHILKLQIDYEDF